MFFVAFVFLPKISINSLISFFAISSVIKVGVEFIGTNWMSWTVISLFNIVVLIVLE